MLPTTVKFRPLVELLEIHAGGDQGGIGDGNGESYGSSGVQGNGRRSDSGRWDGGRVDGRDTGANESEKKRGYRSKLPRFATVFPCHFCYSSIGTSASDLTNSPSKRQ